jgi:alpha-L-arabinofuranosidase
MRRVDPHVELVACGSSGPAMPTFGSWERTVLEHCYADVDYLALHCYVEETRGDTGSFLASGLELDAYIDGVVATVDHARAVGRHRSRVDLSFDEWNVWFAAEDAEHRAEGGEPAEATYDVADAVVVGGLLMSLLRHADRVRIGCQAQLVNVLAPIRTTPRGPAWRQTIFHPYALTSRHGRGAVLRAAIEGPRHPTERYGEVPTVDAVPVWHDDVGELVVFLVNRDQEAAAPVEVALHGPLRLVSAAGVVLADDDPGAANSEQEPERVRPRPLDGIVVDGRRVRATLPPLAWGVVRVQARSAL